MNWKLCLLLLLPAFLQGQDLLKIRNGCNFSGEESETSYYQFDASREADSIVAEILNAVSLEKNFVIRSSNCGNALATVENSQRYILYNTTFLEQFKRDTRTRWAAYSVFAHEIGHHLQGHDFSETDPVKRKKMELEADKFSGGVLRMLGACLEDAQAGVSTFALAGETATHPSGSARREAVASGWKKKDEQLGTPCNGAAKVPESATDMKAVSTEIYSEITAFEDKLQNIVRFLPYGDRMFEYPQKIKEYNEYIKGYNPIRDTVFQNRIKLTAKFKALYPRNDEARNALDNWYKTALENIHLNYILVLDGQVQKLFHDVGAEKISPSKAGKQFRANWAADAPLYITLKKNVDNLTDLRKQLSGFLKS
jgi:hypothetical protein